MTGRVCPVHGEWSATGACRWCEAEDVVQMKYIQPFAHSPTRYWPVRSMTRDELVEEFGDESPAEELARIDACVVGESPGASALRDAAELAQYLALFPAAQEHLLALEHAALRWERVARKWNYKHRTAGGLDEAGRAYVWRWWLEQTDRSAAGLPLAGPFPLGFYAW